MVFTAQWQRTHTCGELGAAHAGTEVVLNGWVNTWRHHGGVMFVNIRDRYGVTQLLFNPDLPPQVWERAQKLRHEFVIAVKGTVRSRPETMINPAMATGHIEVVVQDIEVLNESEPLPVQLHNEEREESEETRLRYRYLDLRRPAMQRNLIFRHHVVAAARQYLWQKQFLEIETPILMKSTPEGARDFLVPSRLNPGRFYALPQSPQTYKQILMISGYDRYFQLARCFRDEDLRADRQPEFTQIDAELSFVTEEDIYNLFEGMMQHIFKQCLGWDLSLPFRRMDYDEAFFKYGSDKPDVRFDMTISDVADLLKDSDFKVFSSALAAGGRIAALVAPAGASLSRKAIDELTEHVGRYGAKGLVWARVKEGAMESPTAKFFTPQQQQAIFERCGAGEGDMVFLIAAAEKVCFTALGQLRLELGRRLNLIDPNLFCFLWVSKFPMFEFSEEEQRYMAMHHPFTAPLQEDIDLLGTDEFHRARARAYDMVLNGTELGGGSIRIHNRDLQKQVFSRLGIGEQEAEEKFGFLLDAFQYGAPPHCGIAFGLDRLVMLMLRLDSIREVIPFPKTSAGLSLMDNAPDRVDERQLQELGIALRSEDK